MSGPIATSGEEAARGEFREAALHFCRNVPAKAPMSRRAKVAAMLKAIHAQESLDASAVKEETAASSLDEMKPKKTARCVRGWRCRGSHPRAPP